MRNLRLRHRGYFVPDLTDFDPTFEQAVPHGVEVGDDEIGVAK